MDWKRILNKKKAGGRKQTVCKPPEGGRFTEAKAIIRGKTCTEEEQLTEGELRDYLEALVTELNFRLLMEPKEETSATEAEEILMAMQPEQMLWVDGIILTSYEEREEKPAHSREKAGQHFKRLRYKAARFFRRLFSRQ